MKTWALYGLKGGVGKTAAATNLAFEAADAGKHVLLWDLDPQGAASWTLGVDANPDLSIKRLIEGKDALGHYVAPTAYEQLHVLPACALIENGIIVSTRRDSHARCWTNWLRRSRKAIRC